MLIFSHVSAGVCETESVVRLASDLLPCLFCSQQKIRSVQSVCQRRRYLL